MWISEGIQGDLAWTCSIVTFPTSSLVSKAWSYILNCNVKKKLFSTHQKKFCSMKNFAWHAKHTDMCTLDFNFYQFGTFSSYTYTPSAIVIFKIHLEDLDGDQRTLGIQDRHADAIGRLWACLSQ